MIFMEKEFDFDRRIQREGTHSVKWHVPEGELPMWVADMDFETAPAVLEAIQTRAAHGVFGYTYLPEEWYVAIQNWWQDRHQFSISKEWLLFSTGVVPSVSSIIRHMTDEGSRILVQTPVYHAFFHSIQDNDREILESPLENTDGVYSICYERLERDLADEKTQMMILCNPHNPIGRFWSAEELEKIGALCARHGVMVLSDEIHCDLADPGYAYVPFASVNRECAENSITCIAPTKAFNLAGIQSSAVIVPDIELRSKARKALRADHIASPGCFAVEAAIAAFARGGPWLDALCAYVSENKRLVRSFVERELQDIRVTPSAATYLLWLDCGQLTEDSEKFARFLRQETGLYVNAGSIYSGDGNRFLRMNVACPRSMVEDGLQRFQKGVLLWKQAHR